MVFKSDSNTGDKTVFTFNNLPSGIHQQKATCAVRIFHTARLKATLAEKGALLITRSAGNGDFSSIELKIGLAVNSAGRTYLRKNASRNIQQL